MDGYDRAILEANLSPKHILTDEHSSFSLAESLFDRALQQSPNLDGIFCTNDDIAIGALLIAQKRGIKVPEQLSIIGYNALDIGQVTSPKLTSIDTPRYQIGKKSTELLLSALAGEEITQKVHNLGFTITQGGSL